jgi:hypothetical protein
MGLPEPIEIFAARTPPPIPVRVNTPRRIVHLGIDLRPEFLNEPSKGDFDISLPNLN